MSGNSRKSAGLGAAALAGWVGLSLGAGALGALASVSAQSFYADLVQPAWAPPPWLFGPVWTALYILMGLAAWLTWREGPSSIVRRALWLFAVQLALNALWTWIFFAWRLGALALAEILLLCGLIGLTAGRFARIRTLAGLLLWPYFAWVAFASALNAALWLANPDLL
jgi:tryptophan-rich sensory protein